MPVKYCKKKHNIVESWNQLQVGTFQHYRELDPNFTNIADAEESYVHIATQLGDYFEVSFAQWNSVFGEGMRISPEGSIDFRKNKRTLPGHAHFDTKNGKFEIDVKRQVLKFSGDIDFKLYYPNTYMFCMTLDDPSKPRDPKTISADYDSCYGIHESHIQNFMGYVAQLITKNVKLEDLQHLDKFQSHSIFTFSQGLACNPIVHPVEYVDEKRILLTKMEQFEKNALIDLYFQSLFRKNIKFKGDNELRIIFPLIHPKLGLLSVREEPLKIDLKQILTFLE